jgi:uncharacterized membrane protein
MHSARAKIAGHPVHPMLIVFPIGLFITSFIFDLVYLAAGDPFWYRTAFWTMLIGFIGTLAAALPGFADYLSLSPKTEARRIATYHMVVGMSLAALYFVNLMVRDWGAIGANRTPWLPVGLNLLGVLLISVQGWLGGELVYRHGVGVEDKDLPREERLRKVV